ncbi:Tetratricopeptide repeat (TPR)-like superfamily protein [Abeliophyllum distichum]|uniref:Tetratricopeptide repeat (TPR)-like superfamily protein n=1 Tax=Abeliophyllum distichum TaxID=126358 RepID=A0ABD1VW58_9LAMI
MRLNSVPSSVEFPRHVPQAFTPSSVQSFLFTPSSSTKKCERDRTVCRIVLSNPFVSRNLFKSCSSKKTLSRGHTNTRSCRSNLDEIFHEDRLGKGYGIRVGGDNEGRQENKQHCTISEINPSSNKYGMNESQFYFLEPMMLGIRPDPPDWPEREAVIRVIIEHKAKSFDIPVSLRMIKKKLQREEGFTDSGESAVTKVFASMVRIIVELQSYALRMREELRHEDLEMIMDKVQKEMHLSFVWLFQQVLSRTPSLMIYVMVLLANFSVYSASHNVSLAETSLMGASYGLLSEENQNGHIPQIDSSIDTILVKEDGCVGNIGGNMQIGNSHQISEQDLRSVEEVKLWDSMVDEATKMQLSLKDEVLAHNMMQHFVSPVFVELEPDEYEDYHRTDLLYQMNLSREPNNPLLLCNYAQFLHLVAHDYARAEECYKRAVQVLPPDAESLSQYANFLFTVRRDFWGAEERFLQALAAEPENSYYASRYANYLWSTGGEETCFPLDNSHSNTSSSNS